MELRDYLRILRMRWISVAVTTAVVILAALAYSLTTTPVYQASTRLFVSTSASADINDAYQGTLYSQERVLSYTQLLTGSSLAKRTIDRLHLDMSPDELAANVTAEAAPNTVLINVHVNDTNPARAADIANGLSDEFAAFVKELETPTSGGNPTSRVVVEQRAEAPSGPILPATTRNVALGAILGLLLGIGGALLRDRLDNTVKDRSTVEDLGETGLVGTIPFDKNRQKSAAIRFADESSPSAESFRSLRTNLQFLDVDNPPRAIVITSSMPAEGKSTTAINLALALAEGGHKVLLLEGDLRRPIATKYLNVVGTVGLSNVLAHQASLDDVIQGTSSSLQVLAAGPIPPNPSELLGSETARSTIEKLRQMFDFVIIDAPPVLPVTDAAILASAADGALVIARHGKTKRDQFERAVDNLRAVNARVLGAIITMSPSRRGDAYYGYSYAYTKAPRRAKHDK
ncbi:polysaccharide biosynthesis tyrosine autokinase [Smaragdicoccus niigatensis]|uniref:polysaccharide biosynthesis tyrosine autokinase n=1 Tax=Smaragdicoccus niigatensis TaxID=359359 RepID=UPI0009DBACF3|nr:polysaccharide biosynthesis tyrosine autokinase [Smaragdicoccus niigatensis]